MLRYRPKVRWDVDLDCEITDPPPLTVIETDDGIPTGILDEQGNELFRYEKISPGFFRDA